MSKKKKQRQSKTHRRNRRVGSASLCAHSVPSKWARIYPRSATPERLHHNSIILLHRLLASSMSAPTTMHTLSFTVSLVLCCARPPTTTTTTTTKLPGLVWSNPAGNDSQTEHTLRLARCAVWDQRVQGEPATSFAFLQPLPSRARPPITAQEEGEPRRGGRTR